jgi:hypothetical protein
LYRPAVGIAGILAAYAIMVVMLWSPESSFEPFWQVGGTLAALFLLCLACHGEVYRLRPATPQLTGYYLALAAGGALGGVFVTIVAPLIFTSNIEMYLAMFAAFAAVLGSQMRDAGSRFHRGAHWPGWVSLSAVAALAAGVIWFRAAPSQRGTTYRSRNFYGVLQINQMDDPQGKPLFNVLRHGRIVHGVQFVDPNLQRQPTGYYGPNSGPGVIMQSFPFRPRKVGVIGLGTGTLALYGSSGDKFVFFELNPRVIDLARERFSFLNSSQASVEVIPGDARLTLEREESQHFDLLFLDAFNGDAVPVHLLTTEAFEIYRKHLDENGAIIVNVSNSFLRLDQLLVQLARRVNYQARLFVDDGRSTSAGTPSVWMLLTNNRALLDMPLVKQFGHEPRGVLGDVQPWTDDHTSLFEILIE